MPYRDFVRSICPVIKYITCFAALSFLVWAVNLFYREYESDGDYMHVAAHLFGIIAYLIVITSDHPVFVGWSLLGSIQNLIDLVVVRFVGENEVIRARFRTCSYHVYQMVLGIVSSMFSTILGQNTSSNSQHVLINGLTSAGILLFSLSLSCDDYGGSSFFTSYILSYIVTTTYIPYFQMIMYALVPSSKYVIVPLCEFILGWVREENEEENLIRSIIQKPEELLEDIDQQPLRVLRFRLHCATIAFTRTGNDLMKEEADHEESKKKLKTHKTEYDNLKANFEAEKEKVKNLISEREKSEKKLRDDLEAEQEKVKNLISEREKSEKKLRDDFEAEQKKVQNLDQEISDLILEHEASENKLIESHNTEYEKMREAAKKKVTSLNQDISQLKNEYKKLENEKSTVIENHKKENEELKAEKGKVTNLLQQISVLENAKKDLEEEKTRLTKGHETKSEKLNEDHEDENPKVIALNESSDIDWDSMGFGFTPTDYMFVMKCSDGENFVGGESKKFGNIELSPASAILNYGQGLFEGLKAYRKRDGNIMLFRPKENAARLLIGAERMCMPSPTENQFLEAVKATVLANKRWIPPLGKGSLYIRPLLMGSGIVLGVAPAPEYTFLIYVSPVGNYFKEGLSPISLKVVTEMHRATPGGTGGVKTVGNYAAVLRAQKTAKAEGFSDVLYLDAIHNRYLEEVTSCNIFVVKGDVISTPEIKGTILPGITRMSILDIAQSKGFKTEERQVTVEELLGADEVFCTGTAVGVSPVGSITYIDTRVTYASEDVGSVTKQFYTELTSLQTGVADDKMGWTMEIK